MTWMHDVLTVAYAVCGVLSAVGYWPQFLATLRTRDGARDISLGGWFLFAATSWVSVAYTTIVLRDPPAVGVALGNAVGCSAVLGTAYVRRRGYARRALAARA